MRVVAADNVRVRNAVARLEAGADLQVQGTVARPALTGRIAVSPGGQIVYRDVRYAIVAANVDFLERERIMPYLSLDAETQVQEYTIRLRIEGTAERFDYSLTSEPPLGTADIIALLTTGATLGTDSASTAGGDLAANYFAGILADPVTRQIERWVGVDRIEINPLYVEDQGDPTTRVTLSEEIAPDVVVVFSTDIGRSERQIYRVNWFATSRMRVALENDTGGGVGGEVGYLTRFWPWGHPPPSTESSEPLPAQRTEITARLAVGQIHIRGVSDKVASELRSRIGIDPGEPFTRSAMLRAIEDIRQYYVDRGRIEARAEATAIEHAGAVDVLYEIEPGPAVDVLFDGVTEKQARQLTAVLRQFWTESMFPEELYTDSAERIRRYFEEKGYYAVDVSYSEDLAAGTRTVRFRIDTGKPIRVDEVVLEGGAALPEERIRRQMLTEPSSLFSKRTVVPSVLAEDRLAVRQLFREEGFLHATVAPPRVRLAADGESATVAFGIDEGPRFFLERIDVAETAGISSSRLIEEVGLALGEPFAPSKVLIGETRLRALFDKRGYPEVSVRGEVALAGQGVVITYHIEPGPRMRVGEIRVRGNARTDERIIRRELAFGPGDHLSRERHLTTQQALYRLGIFRRVRVTYEPLAGGAAGISSSRSPWRSLGPGSRAFPRATTPRPV